MPWRRDSPSSRRRWVPKASPSLRRTTSCSPTSHQISPLLCCDWKPDEVGDGDQLRVDLVSGKIENLTRGTALAAEPMSEVQLAIYRRGGLLRPE